MVVNVVGKFEELSKEIWKKIELASRLRTIFGEETITDSILLELASQHYWNIRIIQTPKVDEAKKGTDWEWFVGSPGTGWVRYALQAKKISIGSGRYSSLKHRVGIKSTDPMQVDILKRYAKGNHAVPLYTFYNHASKADASKHWHCSLPFDKNCLDGRLLP